eukprot:m.175656 g.175656  ORF g.175656 m.175656 type:complete len:94 (+) comp16786_c2_seq1:53-334(+)
MTGLVYYKPSFEAEERLVIPVGSTRIKLLQEHHEAGLSGHLGYKRQRQQMLRRYWWIGIDRDLKKFCRQCETCQRNKSAVKRLRGPLQPLDVP